MKTRITSPKAEEIFRKITKEIIEQANVIVDEKQWHNETKERELVVYDSHFCISTESSMDYCSYKFWIRDDGTIFYGGYEGDFKD